MRCVIISLFLIRASLAQKTEHEDLTKKVNFACKTSITFHYDFDSLKKHNKDIEWDQTDGGNECNEPLRYLWYSCKTKSSADQIKRSNIKTIRCVGTSKKIGDLSIDGTEILVTRAFEEPRPYERSKRQFEHAFKYTLTLEPNPYHDEGWNQFRQQPVPIEEGSDHCLVNNDKVEFDENLHDSFIRRKESASIVCWKNKNKWSELKIVGGQMEGFVTHSRGDSYQRHHFKNGEKHGQSSYVVKDKTVRLEQFENGLLLFTTTFHQNGKVERYSRNNLSPLSYFEKDEKGRLTAISCSPETGNDSQLSSLCGFQKESHLKLYDPNGIVMTELSFKNGQLTASKGGTSPYSQTNTVQYENGQKVGLEEVKDSKGRLVASIQWKNGKKNGEERLFHPASQKLRQKQIWQDGIQTEEIDYYDNGSRKEHVTFHGEGKATREHYNDSDILYLREVGSSDKFYSFTGISTGFHENGNIASERTIQEGRVIALKRWNNDKELVEYRLFHLDGSLKEDRLGQPKKTKDNKEL